MAQPQNEPNLSNLEPSSSLLHGVQGGAPEAWQRLVRLYAPVVARWCRRAGLQDADADDVLQEVFRALARKVADFRRNPAGGGFHAWLFTVTHNKIRDHFRRQVKEPAGVGGTSFLERLNEEALPAGDGSISSTTDHDSATLLRRSLDLVRPEFEAKTWQAFWRAAVDEQDPVDIARDLGLTVNAVRLAKSRVLRRLRRELDGLTPV